MKKLFLRLSSVDAFRVLSSILLTFGVIFVLGGCSKSAKQSDNNDQNSLSGIETRDGGGKTSVSRHAFSTSKAGHQVANAPQGRALPADVTGSVIRFGLGGGAERYCVSGWSQPEDHFVWTEGNVATLTLPIYARPDSLLLRLKAKGVINPPEVNFQPVHVYADGKKVAEWKVTGMQDYTAKIPGDLTKNGGRLLLELRTPKAIRSNKGDQPNDARTVALYCYELELRRQ